MTPPAGKALRRVRRTVSAAALACLAAAVFACTCDAIPSGPAVRKTYTVVNKHPHDPEAFTQGLLWHDGRLYESTGLKGASTVREVSLEDGKVLRSRALGGQYFGEGLACDGDRLVQLTWQHGKGFVYRRETFEPVSEFSYLGEGWGLTFDGSRFILSDGTSNLRFLDPETFAVVKTVQVTSGGKPVGRLNELEWVEGRIYANIWQEDIIAVIVPDTGEVEAWIDLTGILTPEDRAGHRVDVLNGIAYDPATKRLWVTGKEWPVLYEITLRDLPAAAE